MPSSTDWSLRRRSIAVRASASVFGDPPCPTQSPTEIRRRAEPWLLATDLLAAGDQQGGAVELLDGQEPKRVAHEHGDAVAGLVRSRRRKTVNAMSPR